VAAADDEAIGEHHAAWHSRGDGEQRASPLPSPAASRQPPGVASIHGNLCVRPAGAMYVTHKAWQGVCLDVVTS
jgi:hypothetical protein